MSLEMRPSDLPSDPDARRAELPHLGDLLGLSQGAIRRKVRETPQYAGYPVVLRQGVDRRLLFYLLENQDSFPGVRVERTYVRDYKDGSLAAHVLGLVGQVTPHQLDPAGRPEPASPATSSARRGSSTPTTSSSRGTAGSQRIQVDALGRPGASSAAAPPGPATTSA